MLAILASVAAAYPADKAPLGKAVDGIAVTNFLWSPNQNPSGRQVYTVEGIAISDFFWSPSALSSDDASLQVFNFKITIQNLLKIPIHNLQIRIFFYDAQDRPLTNAILKYRPMIPAGSKISAQGFVDPKIKEVTAPPPKEIPVDKKREELLAESAKKETELTKKMDELTRQIDQRSAQLAELQKDIVTDPERVKEIKRLQGEKADLERQLNEASVWRTQTAKLKDELSIARRLELIRLGISAGGGITNACKLEFQVLSFDRLE